MYIHIHMHVRICVCLYIYIYTYTYTHIYIYTYVCGTYTHIQICVEAYTGLDQLYHLNRACRGVYIGKGAVLSEVRLQCSEM